VDAVVVLAVGVVELLGAGGVERLHLRHQRLTDVGQQHVVGQLVAQRHSRSVTKRGSDEPNGVDHRTVQVEDDGFEAPHLDD
jgi:hypothetical protein